MSPGLRASDAGTATSDPSGGTGIPCPAQPGRMWDPFLTTPVDFDPPAAAVSISVDRAHSRARLGPGNGWLGCMGRSWMDGRRGHTSLPRILDGWSLLRT